MAAVRHLGFSKVGNFNFRSHSKAQYASPYQISRRSVEPFRRYIRFSIFQDGGCRHLGFWKFQIFNCWNAQEGRTAFACQILSKSLKPRLRYGDLSIFQDGEIRVRFAPSGEVVSHYCMMHTIRYDIFTCAQKLTKDLVSLGHGTETKNKD